MEQLLNGCEGIYILIDNVLVHGSDKKIFFKRVSKGLQEREINGFEFIKGKFSRKKKKM